MSARRPRWFDVALTSLFIAFALFVDESRAQWCYIKDTDSSFEGDLSFEVKKPTLLTLILRNPCATRAVVKFNRVEIIPAYSGKASAAQPAIMELLPGASGSMTMQCETFFPGETRFDLWTYIEFFDSQGTLVNREWFIGQFYVQTEHELKVANVEPVQAVYGAPLVAFKPTLVRTTFENMTSETQSKRVLVASPHPYGNNPYQTFRIETLEIPPGSSRWLLPTTGWLEPRLEGRFVVSVDPDVIDNWGPCEPEGKSPTTLKVYQELLSIKPPKMQFPRLSVIDYQYGFTMDANPVSALEKFRTDTVEYLNAVFPMPPIGVEAIDMPYLPTVGDLNRIFVQLEDAAVQSGVERIVGLLPNDLAHPYQSYYGKVRIPARFGEANNVIGAAGRAAVVKPFDPSLPSATLPVIAAHELGHLYGLPRTIFAREEYGDEGSSLSDGKPASPGVWVQGRGVLANDDLIQIDEGTNSAGQPVTNFMGRDSMFRVGASIKKWVTNESYEFMLRRFAQRGVDPEILFVSASISPDGNVEAGPWYTFLTDQPSISDAQGTHHVVLLGDSGQELATFGFTPTFWRYQDPAPAESEVTSASVALAVPTVPGWREIQLRQGDTVLYARQATPNAPTVSVTSPTAGEVLLPGTSSPIAWSASDADGNPLSHTVLFSSDGGASWTPLALNTPDSSLAWEVPDVDASCAVIKVRTTDGLLTAEAASACFKIQGTATAPLLARPGRGQTTTPGTPVQLDGSASLNSQGAALSLAWEVAGSPAGGDGQLANETTAAPTFTAWTPGRYLVSLVVSDGVRSSTPAFTDVQVTGVNPDNPNVVLSTGHDESAVYARPAPALMGNLDAVSAGGNHVLALKKDGTVWAWGSNAYGQLGDRTNENRTTPVQVVGLSGVIAVAAGKNHSLAIRSDGKLWAWGKNDAGQLGIGPDYDKPSPVLVGALSGIKAVAAGSSHSLALQDDGTVWAWGANGSGQLGDGTTQGSAMPVQVTGLGGTTAIAAGATHSLAVLADGTVWAWGANGKGQLGDGTWDMRTAPVQVLDLKGIASVAAGETHSLALGSDRMVWAWGDNFSGQLGDATWQSRERAVRVSSLTDAQAVAANGGGSMALRTDGTVWAWGAVNGEYAPARIERLTGVASISVGEGHHWAVDGNATAWSWGSNENGVLGRGVPSAAGTLTQVPGLVSPTQVASCGHHLVLRADGSVWAWGGNYSGQLGDGTTTNRLEPVRVSAMNGASRVAVGTAHSLALKTDGTVWAWGQNTYGQIGDGTTVNRPVPVRVPGLEGVLRVASGFTHNMAVAADRTVWTWGYNYSGQLGNGNTATRYAPGQVSGLANVAEVSAGGSHSLALKQDGTVWAWGGNGSGQLGDGTTSDRYSPVQVAGLANPAAIAAGGSHNLALMPDGTVRAWGANGSGQLGDGTTTDRSEPGEVAGLTGVIAIAAGDETSIALKRDGTAWAWGRNLVGQLGDGTTINRLTPVQVGGVSGIIGFAAGVNSSIFLGLPTSAPAVTTVWPAADTCEPESAAIVVSFNRSVMNVTADDLVLSGGTVVGVSGSGAGPYVFQLDGVPLAPIHAALAGDIADQAGQPLGEYQWTFGNAGAPIITQEPGNQNLCVGGTAQFTVTADGASGYQWQKDGINLLEDAHCSGTTSPTLTVNNAGEADIGNYRCVLMGNCPVATRNAELRVYSGPVIEEFPPNQSVCAGGTVQLAVKARNVGALSHEWSKAGVPLVDDDRISGAHSATLSIEQVSQADAGEYSVILTDDCGSTTPASPLLLQVGDATTLVITQQPSSRVCAGGDVTFEVLASGTGVLAYQWYKDGQMLDESDHRTGTQSVSLVVHGCTADDHGAYTVAVSDDCGVWVSSAEAFMRGPGDCNQNGVPDLDDISAGISLDCNLNGTPDECEFGTSQWAVSVLDFSSQYSDADWSAQQALGPPDTHEYGDFGTAWAPSSENGGFEFITLGFARPVFARGVTIRETSGNGMVYRIDLLDEHDQFHTVWSDVDPSQPEAPVDFRVNWPPTEYLVKGVKITIDTNHDPGWEEIDAVQLHEAAASQDCDGNGVPDECELAGSDCNGNRVPDACDLANGESDCDVNGIPDSCDLAGGAAADCNANGIPDHCDVERQSPSSPWAANVMGFSSQRSETDGSAQQATGEPNTAGYGDAPTAWSPASQNGTLEFLALHFSQYLTVEGLTIRETCGNGMVYRIDLVDTIEQVHTVWTGADPTQPGAPADFHLEWPRTGYLVKGVRIHVDTAHDAGWEQIDAVQVHGVYGSADCQQNGVPDECEFDADGDAIPDECDLCPGTPGGLRVDTQGCPAVYPPCSTFIGADLDRNCCVDWRDLSWFNWCSQGPATLMHEPWYCQAVDFDLDQDVDQADFGVFQRCLSGTGVPVKPDCAD